MANDPETFAELKTAIADWMNRDDMAGIDAELVASAERRLTRDLFAGDREAVATLTATTGTVALPADFDGARTIWLDTTPRIVLEQMTLGQLQYRYPTAETGRPLHFAIMGSTLYLGPAPSASTAIKLAYWQGIPALSDANTTNWLLADHPDVYRSACLVEACLYFHDTPRAQQWEGVTQGKIASIAAMMRRKQYGSAPLVARARYVA